jgi:hypothetical protein
MPVCCEVVTLLFVFYKVKSCWLCRVVSSLLKMSDILECNVSTVEDLHKARQGLPMAAVYFLQPTSTSVDRLVQDFQGGKPLYTSVHIFFSNKVCAAPPQVAQ